MTKREIYQSAYSSLRKAGSPYLIVKAYQKLCKAFGELAAMQFVLLVEARHCYVDEIRSPRLIELVRANQIRKQDEAPEMGADSSHARVNVGV